MQVLRYFGLTELCDQDVLGAPPDNFLAAGLDPFPMSGYSDEVKTYEPFKARLEVRMAPNCMVSMVLKGPGAYAYLHTDTCLHLYTHQYEAHQEKQSKSVSWAASASVW